MESDYQIVVTDCSDITTDVRMLTLRSIEGKLLPDWTAGAHIELDINGFVRQYSITSGDSRHYKIAVLRDPESRGGSDYIHGELQPGELLSLTGVRNNFPFVPPSNSNGVTFIVGGIGITPILPMVHTALVLGLEVDLHYGARSEEHLVFLSELEVLKKNELFSMTIYRKDREGDIAVGLAIAQRPVSDPVYCCGPPGLIEAVHTSGSLAGRIVHSELFRPPSDFTTEGDEFFVTVGEYGTPLLVPSGFSLLETLHTHGYNVRSSCEEGTCGTCELRVLSGAPDHRDHVLSQTERDLGESIIPCVSRAHGTLTVEI